MYNNLIFNLTLVVIGVVLLAAMWVGLTLYFGRYIEDDEEL